MTTPEAPAAAPAAFAPPVMPVAVATPEPPAEAFPRLGAGLMPGPKLKTQLTGSDARTDRLVKDVRQDLDRLRRKLDAFEAVPADLTEVDLDAVAGHPDEAAALPPALLVRGLVRAHSHNERLATENDAHVTRIAELEEEVHDLREEKSYMRGRLETMEQVVAALHANIQDLRLARDAAVSHAVVEPGPAPRVLRPAPADLLAEAAEA
ncbi:MAG: hypothetical protein ACKVVT_11210 [Dehalococcoidia bacterium]